MTSMPRTARRSLLFTPANRPALFDKSLASGADMIIIDLEDAVAADQKASSRADAVRFLAAAGPGPERVVRINRPDTPDGAADMEALIAAAPAGGLVLIPKVEEADLIRQLDACLGSAGSALRIGVMIETILGVENSFRILKDMPRLEFAMFGGADLAAELGTQVEPEPLAYGRARLVYAARHAGIDVFDMPCLSFRDVERVRQETELAARTGFTGKAAIHPDNIAVINAAFTPTPAELDEARRFVEAYRNSTTGVAVVDGKLVEIPTVRVMERKLARGRAAGLVS